MRVSTGALVFAVAALVLLPAAAAHANYYSSDPPRGARLQTPPPEVQVTLSEAIDPKGSGLEVEDVQGRPVDAGDVRIDEGPTPVLRVSLQGGLGPGVYTARWRALSSVDGHVTSGSWRFAVGNYTASEATESVSRPPWLSAASRTLAYVGYALTFGALAFRLRIEPGETWPGRRRVVNRALLAGTAPIVAGVGAVAAMTMFETGLGAGAFLRTSVGRTFALRLLMGAAAVAAAAWAGRRPVQRASALVATLFVLGSAWANSLFVHSADQGWHAVAADFVHLVSVATWLGALTLFLTFIVEAGRKGTYDDVLRVGRRFSTVAFVSVTLLGMSGVVSTILILGTDVLRAPALLTQSPYGRLLVAKVALFGLMVMVAGVNRFIFLGTRPGPDRGAEHRPWVLARLFPQDGPRRARAFAKVAGLEAFLGLVVLGLAGTLTAISPPSATGPAGPAILEASGIGREFQAGLRISPAPWVGGTSNVSLTASLTSDGSPLTEAIRVRVTIAEAADNTSGGESWTAQNGGAGRWVVGDILFAAAGPYEALIEIQTEDVYRDTVRVAFNVSAQPPGLGAAAQEEDVYLHENPFHVAPERIQAQAGQPLVLRVANSGRSVHNLVVCPAPAADPECPDGPGRSPLLPGGATYELRLTLASGTYEYYCSVPGHREAGMDGTLTVGPSGGTSPMSPAWVLLIVGGAIARLRRRP